MQKKNINISELFKNISEDIYKKYYEEEGNKEIKKRIENTITSFPITNIDSNQFFQISY